jgi:hypothetical protein
MLKQNILFSLPAAPSPAFDRPVAAVLDPIAEGVGGDSKDACCIHSRRSATFPDAEIEMTETNPQLVRGFLDRDEFRGFHREN